MHINKITIIEIEGSTDILLFHTDLPSGVWPFTDNLVPRVAVARGTAEEYCNTYFPGILFEFAE